MICFKDKEWDIYVEAAQRASIRSLSERQIEIQACLDCTEQFQLSALNEGLCRPINLGVTPLWRTDDHRLG